MFTTHLIFDLRMVLLVQLPQETLQICRHMSRCNASWHTRAGRCRERPSTHAVLTEVAQQHNWALQQLGSPLRRERMRGDVATRTH